MNPKRKKRLMLILLLVAGIGIATAFALVALNENINAFYSPSDVLAGKAPRNDSFRIGGLVTAGTLKRSGEGLVVTFDLTDNVKSVTVQYEGILPDLFREGQGIIATGRMGDDGRFIAREVLAKHDENYMPPEVAAALKEAEQSGAMPHGVKETAK